VEVLPDRFDRDGRRIDGDDRGIGGRWKGKGIAGAFGNKEMVEKLVGDLGDVVDGRKSWKDLLREVVEGVGGSGAGKREGDDGDDDEVVARRRRRR